MRRRLGRNDGIFIGILAGVCVIVFIVFSVLYQSHGSTIVITRDGELYGKYNLSQDQTIAIENTDHQVTNTLQIRDGEAKMIGADCPDKLCMHQKAISVSKENIVCLPNRIVVTVEDDDTEGLDGFAQ